MIVVTHKPSLLAEVDKVLMLKNGQVAMFGPRDAVFRKLLEAQNQQKTAAGV
jgi:ABC-type protease/lipase transport system fused ATPase/permease subunit